MRCHSQQNDWGAPNLPIYKALAPMGHLICVGSVGTLTLKSEAIGLAMFQKNAKFTMHDISS